MMLAFICLISIPIPAMFLSIDEIILSNSTSPHTYNFFHINSNGTVKVKLEYDMIMSIDRYKDLTIQFNGRRRKRGAIRWKDYLWPNEKVYFEIADEMWNTRNVILEAVAEWQRYTCLEFIESKSPNRILVQNGFGCYADFGYTGQLQGLYLDSYCRIKFVILHEIGHAIGLIHEHSRPDRDFYISMHRSLLNDINWAKLDIRDFNSFGIEYDYRSIMHYGDIFGKMRTLDPAYQSVIGKERKLSFKDIKLVNLLYQCHIKFGDCPPRRCPFNGFVFFKSFKGMPKCTCWCESGNSSDPLVPCCQIDREVPRHNVPERSSNSELNITTCSDLRGNCAYLKEKGMCRTYIKMMYKECTKTCNFCGRGDNLCIDYEDGCHIMAGSGACKKEGLKEIMSKLCKKSCGLCRTVTTPCDMQEDLFEEFRYKSRNNGDSNKMKWITILYVLLIVYSCQL